MRALASLVLLAVFLMVTCCTSSQFVVVAQNDDSNPVVQIFFHNQLPERNYKVIGHIETSGWIFTSNKSLLNGMLVKAANNGADAVIHVEYCKIPHILTSIPCVSGLAIQYID